MSFHIIHISSCRNCVIKKGNVSIPYMAIATRTRSKGLQESSNEKGFEDFLNKMVTSVKDDDTSSASSTTSSSSSSSYYWSGEVQIQWFLDPPLLMILLLSLLIMFALMAMSLITMSLHKDPVMEILPLCLDSPRS